APAVAQALSGRAAPFGAAPSAGLQIRSGLAGDPIAALAVRTDPHVAVVLAVAVDWRRDQAAALTIVVGIVVAPTAVGPGFPVGDGVVVAVVRPVAVAPVLVVGVTHGCADAAADHGAEDRAFSRPAIGRDIGAEGCAGQGADDAAGDRSAVAGPAARRSGVGRVAPVVAGGRGIGRRPAGFIPD